MNEEIKAAIQWYDNARLWDFEMGEADNSGNVAGDELVKLLKLAGF